MRVPFVIGRLTVRSAEIVLVAQHQNPPIPGPWSLRALVRSPSVLRLIKA